MARAAATDKANRRMRKSGRTAWSLGDYNCAVREYYRLCETAGIQSPAIAHCHDSALV